ncbi:Squalene epoxidase [Boothiomyces sp. JEL0866]|nr:Squalene epoxidase [Boothiomyces sp. JEL0866]
MLTGVVTDYDIIVIGAGVVGTAAAYSLGNIGKKVLLVERDWKEPDRIVGELLQPGGVEALRQMNMEDCLKGMDGIAVHGYAVIKKNDEVVLPYPDVDVNQGLSFHHGKFIMNLRTKAKSCSNVTCLEGTATELIKCEYSEKYVGVEVKVKQDGTTFQQKYFADLTIVADGCFSIFRKQFISKSIPVKSHFVGLVLKDCQLPYPNHGHVILADPSPILLYQIGTRDTRILVDIPAPLPNAGNGDLKRYMHDCIAEQLPETVKPSFYSALESDRLRSMPCSWLPPTQNSNEGVIILGDAQNMRHPLTGGGMTVAFWDVVHLRNMLQEIPDLSDTLEVKTKIESHHWRRKGLSTVVNVLANALYALFSAGKDPYIIELQNACFAYFLLGGNCAQIPVELLAGIRPEPMTLFYHFFAVALYAVYLVCSGPIYLLPYNFAKNGTPLDCLTFRTPIEIFAFVVVGIYILGYALMMFQLLRGWLQIPPSKIFYFVWAINIEAFVYLVIMIPRYLTVGNPLLCWIQSALGSLVLFSVVICQMDLLKVFVINSKLFTIERITAMQYLFSVYLISSCGGLYASVGYLGGYLIFTVSCIIYESFHAVYVSRAVVAQATRKRTLQASRGTNDREAVYAELYYLTLIGIFIDWTAGILWVVGWFAEGTTATSIGALSNAVGMGHCLFLTLTFKRIKKVNIRKITDYAGTATSQAVASSSTEKSLALQSFRH